MKYVMIFHANLNYAYLVPERYEHVIRKSYENIIDTFREHFPEQKYVFEASGYTLEQIEQRTPDVLEKLKDAIAKGQCEFMGSPYAHPQLANFPEEDGYHSLIFSQETYQRVLGLSAKSGWNPECGWMQYVPCQFQRAGFKYLMLDFDSYAISTRPHIREIEYNPDKNVSHGLNRPWYELPPDEPALHFPFKDVVPGLNGFARTDRLAQVGIRYFVNEEKFDEYYSRVKKFSSGGKGGLIVYSDDAEYVGTRGWFDIKYKDRKEGFFAAEPESKRRLIAVLQACIDLGSTFTTFEDVCTTLPCLEEKYYCEDQLAWHRTWATAWATTPNARAMDPVVNAIRDRIHIGEKTASTQQQKESVKNAWFHLTCGENTDGRWPPPPATPHPFNVKFCEDHLKLAEEAIAWVKEPALR
jgi:hypothetical protein